MAQRVVYFDAESLLRLLTHYSDGKLPLDSQLKAAGTSEFIAGWLGLFVDSKEWPEGALMQPLHLRYEGKKIMTWDEKGTPAQWQDGNERPKGLEI